MKKYILLALVALTLSALHTHAQTAVNKKEKVVIINSSSRAVALLDNYFNEGITNTILKQVSPARLLEIKKYSNESSYPECFRKLIAADSEDELFGNLTAYRIAKFDNIRNGENFGEESILLIPASENAELMGSDCVFNDSFYIIIYSKDIEVDTE